MPVLTVYVGTYTKPAQTDGIFIYRMDGATGVLTFVGATESSNPSFLSISADHRFLYAVNELNEFDGQSGGGLTAFAIDPQSGLLTRLNAQPTKGTEPCYVSVDQGLAFVANYGGGSISVFPISDDGRLGDLIQTIQHHGSSIHTRRQTAPHVHSVVLDPAARYALVADLGIDKIVIYHLDRSNATSPLTKALVTKALEISVEAGSGPRHMAFHPTGRFLYLVNELFSTVTGFAYSQTDGTLHPLQNISALPADFAGANIAADIHVAPSGLYLYVSNRGHDSIAIFAIDPATGHLTLAGYVPTQGKTPRNFAFDPTGNWLLVGNKDSNNVVQFKVEQATGTLTPTGQIIGVPSPACVKIVEFDG